MNVIMSGPDGCGKTALSNYLLKRYDFDYVHSTAKAANTLDYFISLLNSKNNTILDRFSAGEMVFPKIYNRPAKITHEEFIKTLEEVKLHSDIYVLFIASDAKVLKDRLINRNELNYLEEIDAQIDLYNNLASEMKAFFKDYSNFYVCDVSLGYKGNCNIYSSNENPYRQLYSWIDKKLSY